jgi:hypothetical protein
MRGTFLLIVQKVLRILDKMSDDEIHRLVLSAQKASEAASHMLTDNNINKTMHVMDDADYTMMKFDKMLSKFVN